MRERRSKTVVITGASAGVGRATARLFGRQGARVALLGRGRDGLEAAKRDVEAVGGEAVVLPTDVSDWNQVREAAVETERRLGAIDVWINNAMVSVFAPFREMTADEFRRVNDVCYMGFVHGTKAALDRMLPRDRGVIVQVGSALAYRGIPLQSAYCGAKHAIQGFSESVRTELIHDRSRVKITMVQMPALNTPQFRWVKSRLPRKPQPVPPIYQPEVAARAVVWAARHPRREVNVGFSTTLAVMGNNLFPGLGDRYLGRTGFKSQQTSDPVDPDRRENIWEPVPGDAGAHGDFDARARSRSWQWSLTTHRGLVAAGAAVAFLALRHARETGGRP